VCALHEQSTPVRKLYKKIKNTNFFKWNKTTGVIFQRVKVPYGRESRPEPLASHKAA